MLEGLPPTLPPAVARLFLKKPDARLDQHETAEVVQREQQFYKHEAVVRAGKLIDRYIAREEAALLIGAAWKMVRLRREAQALTRRSLRELKDAASLDEDLEVARESMRESGRSGRGSDDAEEQLATSADGKGEAGVHSAIAAVFASRTAPRVPERPKAVDQAGRGEGSEDTSLEEYFKGYFSKALLSAAEEAGRAESRQRSRSRAALSIDPTSLDLSQLQERARQKVEAAARARALAEAARNAAEFAREQAMERMKNARQRRELAKQEQLRAHGPQPEGGTGSTTVAWTSL